MSRSKSRDCLCMPSPPMAECREGWCAWGYCKEWKCPYCRKVAFGFGPLGCKCDAPRGFIYPDMRKKNHPPIKENAMRKRKRHARNW